MKRRSFLQLTLLAIIIFAFACGAHSSYRVLYPDVTLGLKEQTRGAWKASPVAVEQDTLAIGVPNFALSSKVNGEIIYSKYNIGAVYIYTHSDALWVQQAKFTADDPHNGLGLGSSLAISNNTIVIGCAYNQVYILEKTGSGWIQQDKLTTPRNSFARAVAIDGNTIVVGDEGAAYVYVRDPKTAKWSYQAKLSPVVKDTPFGPAVAISGNTIVVGQSLFGNSINVFVRSPETQIWTHQAEVMIEQDRTIGFGHAVDIQGDTILVGASSEPRGLSPFPCTGAAYIFTRDPKTQRWIQQARLVPHGARLGINSFFGCFPSSYGFGTSVVLDGNLAVVGARPVTSYVGDIESAAYVFERDAETQKWFQTAKILSSDKWWEVDNVSLAKETVVIGDIVSAYIIDLSSKSDS